MGGPPAPYPSRCLRASSSSGRRGFRLFRPDHGRPVLVPGATSPALRGT
ncbi:Hypothetical protein AA314_09989 [Archangium gephyra]|uniref:Uncharacterized protein n=1 Tax=Archangium gephyra TaxID=48 RepID=A0AAC8QIU0_9BACT|nr:Hypothetical protein AA314_09989 [Archangium gephyra]